MALIDDEIRDVLGTGFRRKKTPKVQLTDQQSDTVLKKAGRVGLSGLSAAGNILDIPGSMVRDTVSGQNPFDQLLPWNWATDEHRVSGRELARKAGFAGKKDTWGNLLGGIGVEIGLDPLTYLSGGALAFGKAGKAAKAAGLATDIGKVATKKIGRTVGPREARLLLSSEDLVKHADEAASAAGKPTDAAARFAKAGGKDASETLGGSLGYGLPFRPSAGTFNLPGAQKIARGMDTAGRVISESPVGTVAKGLFGGAKYGGRFNRSEQEAAKATFDLKQSAIHTAQENWVKQHAPMKEIYDEFDKTIGPDIHQAAQATKAGVKDPKTMVANVLDRTVKLTQELGGNIDQAFKEMSLPAHKLTPELRQKILTLNSETAASHKAIRELNEAKGMKTGGVLDEFGEDPSTYGFAHSPRFVKGRPESLLGTIKNFGTRTSSSMGRKEVIKYVPEEIVNKILTDDAARGPKSAEHILSKYGDYLGQEMVEQVVKDPTIGKIVRDPVTGKEVTSSQPKWTKEEHASKLAEWARHKEQFPIFSRTKLENDLLYQTQAHVTGAVGDSIHDLVSKNMTDGVDTGIPLAEVYAKADMDAEKALEWLGKQTGKSADDLKVMTLPEDVANTIISVRKAQADPGPIGKVIDHVNKMFTRNVTLPFPGYVARNLTGGQFMNMASGFVDNPVEYGSYVAKAFKAWLRGDQDLLQKLFTEKVINNQILSEGVQSTLAGGLSYVDNPLNVRKTFRDVSQEVAENPIMQSATYAAPSATDPLSGVTRTARKRPLLNKLANPVRTAYGTMMKTGEKASALVEFLNRAPMYMYLTEAKGWDAATAAQKVGELQVKYDDLAPFEKTVMRRLVPFYSWTRGIAPEILKTLGRRPGGALAQTIRSTRNVSGADATTPEYIASNTSIPLGTQPDGSDRYLTGLGLPHEGPLSYFGDPWNIGKTARRAGLEGLSQLTPLVKGPLEWATNQSFFQSGPSGGRPMEDLDPTLGRLGANLKETITGEKTKRAKPLGGPLTEAVVANTPLSRFTTTARQLSDPRKGIGTKALNALTGLRVSDVSPAAKDSVLRESVQDLMREMGGKTFVRTYFPKKEEWDAMTAEQKQAILQLEALMRAVDKSMKERATK